MNSAICVGHTYEDPHDCNQLLHTCNTAAAPLVPGQRWSDAVPEINRLVLARYGIITTARHSTYRTLYHMNSHKKIVITEWLPFECCNLNARAQNVARVREEPTTIAMNKKIPEHLRAL